MKVLLDIHDSKSVAFLNFIKSLDFVTIKKQEEDAFDTLPKDLQAILLQSEEDIKAGKILSHEQVMRSL